MYSEYLTITVYSIGLLITLVIKYPSKEDLETFKDVEYLLWVTKSFLWFLYWPVKGIHKFRRLFLV